MRLFYFIFLLCLALPAGAQQYFNKRYSLYSHAVKFSAVIPRDNKYYCVGTAWDSSNTSPSTQVLGIKFTILDSVGNILKDTIYQRPGTRNYYQNNNNAFHALPDKGFVMAVEQDWNPATGEAFALIVRFDSLGRLLWTRELSKPCCVDSHQYYSVADMKPTGTGEWLLLTSVQCSQLPYNPTRAVLTKLDSNFNVLWNKMYTYPTPRTFGRRLYIDSTGYYLLNSYSNAYVIIMTGYILQAQIIKTDTSGSVIWNWLSDTAKKNIPLEINRTNSGKYLYAGMGNGYEVLHGGSGDVYFKGWMECLDTGRNRAWADTVGMEYCVSPPTSEITCLRRLQGNAYCAAGNLINGFSTADQDTSGGTSHGFACLLKFREDGSYFWRRKYCFEGDSRYLTSYIQDVKQTPDGGFVLVGTSEDWYHHHGTTRQQAWVIKVDSNGCTSLTDTQCQSLRVKQIAAAQIQVYPNPAGDVVYFELPDGLQVDITLCNMAGKTFATLTKATGLQRITLANLPPGVYLYSISQPGFETQYGRLAKY